MYSIGDWLSFVCVSLFWFVYWFDLTFDDDDDVLSFLQNHSVDD